MNIIISFLRQLEANNNKPWFDAHKGEYLEARAHFNVIVEKLLQGISEFDPTVRGIGIKESTYRIHLPWRKEGTEERRDDVNLYLPRRPGVVTGPSFFRGSYIKIYV